jgi:hypothetical protein
LNRAGSFLPQRFAKSACDLSTGCRKGNCRCLRSIIFSSEIRKRRVYSWHDHADCMVIFNHDLRSPVFIGKRGPADPFGIAVLAIEIATY